MEKSKIVNNSSMIFSSNVNWNNWILNQYNLQHPISTYYFATHLINMNLNLDSKKHKGLLDVKPEHFGKQYAYLSEEIDNILYEEDNT